MRRHSFTWVAVALSTVALAIPMEAQVRGSERAVVKQTVDGTAITVDYARPHARGRSPIFGGVVDWGHIWTPGANWATTFEFSKDVELNGQAVPQGKYSIWMIPQPDRWEVILDPDDRVFHMARPPITEDQISFVVAPVEGPYAEALTFAFTTVRANTADLVFQWGTTQVPMQVTVPSTQTLTVEPDAAAPYPGVYDVSFIGSPEMLESVPPAESWKTESRMELSYADGYLIARWNVGGNQSDEHGILHVMMVPVADQVFHPGWMQNGALYETEVDLYLEFTVEDGKATGFQLRDGIFDMVIMGGTRSQ